MLQFNYTIKDDLGLHARPAGLLVKAADKYPCKISITKGEKTADAKKLFGVMGLCVRCGDTVTMTCDGEQEQEALAEIQNVIEKNL